MRAFAVSILLACVVASAPVCAQQSLEATLMMGVPQVSEAMVDFIVSHSNGRAKTGADLELEKTKIRSGLEEQVRIAADGMRHDMQKDPDFLPAVQLGELTAMAKYRIDKVADAAVTPDAEQKVYAAYVKHVAETDIYDYEQVTLNGKDAPHFAELYASDGFDAAAQAMSIHVARFNPGISADQIPEKLRTALDGIDDEAVAGPLQTSAATMIYIRRKHVGKGEPKPFETVKAAVDQQVRNNAVHAYVSGLKNASLPAAGEASAKPAEASSGKAQP